MIPNIKDRNLIKLSGGKRFQIVGIDWMPVVGH